MMEYRMRFDPFTGAFAISLNGQELSNDQYSAFSQYKNLNISQWVFLLANECKVTANTRYNMTFEGGRLHGMLIRHMLKEEGSLDAFYQVTPLITADHRLSYVAALTSLCLPTLKVYHMPRAGILPATLTLYKTIQIPVSNTSLPADADLIMLDSEGDFQAMAARLPAGKLRVMVKSDTGETRVLSATQAGCCLAGKPDKCAVEWYKDMLLPQALKQVAKTLSADQKSILLSDRPVYRLEGLPTKTDHVMVGDKRAIRYFKFPSNIQCTLSSSKHVSISKAGDSVTVTMLDEGDAELWLGIDGCFRYPVKKYSFHVWQEHPVTTIENITVSKKELIAGDSFTVSYIVRPSNATNLQDIIWKTSAPNVIGSAGKGVPGKNQSFQCKAAGHCDLTIQIGWVTARISLEVFPPAADLSTTQKHISFKVNETNQRWKVNILPKNSKGGVIDFYSSDNAVVIVHPDGKLEPISPGQAEITASLRNHRNTVVKTQKLLVEILPLHSNPEFIQFLGVGASIITLGMACYGLWMCVIFCLLAMLAYVVSFIRTASSSVRKADVILTVLTILLTVLCMC